MPRPHLQIYKNRQPIRTIELTESRLQIGRDPHCDVCIDSPTISRRHCRIEKTAGGYVLTDTSANGTVVNQRRTRQHTLVSGDEILLGNHTLVFVSASTRVLSNAPRFIVDICWDGGRREEIYHERLKIGRHLENDVVFSLPDVSGKHAEIVYDGRQYVLHDLSSTNGTFVIGASAEAQHKMRVTRHVLSHRQCIRIADFDLRAVIAEDHLRLIVTKTGTTFDLRTGLYPTVTEQPSANGTRSRTVVAKFLEAKARPSKRAPLWEPTSDLNRGRGRLAALLAAVVIVVAGVTVGVGVVRDRFFQIGELFSDHQNALQAAAIKGVQQPCSICHVTRFEDVEAPPRPRFASDTPPVSASVIAFSRQVGVVDAKCAACHKSQQPADHHASVAACARCHPDHRGAGVSPIDILNEVCVPCHATPHGRRPEGANVKTVLAALQIPDADKRDPFHLAHKGSAPKCENCHSGKRLPGKSMLAVPDAACGQCHAQDRQLHGLKCAACHTEHGTTVVAVFRLEWSRSGSATRKAQVMLKQKLRPGRSLVANMTPGRVVASLSASMGIGLFVLVSFVLVWNQRRRNRYRKELEVGWVFASVSVKPATDRTIALPPHGMPAEPTPAGQRGLPVIDVDACIGCGACVHACPYSVLEVIDEKAKVMRPEACKLDMACVDICPPGAIKIVGSQVPVREVYVPSMNANLESNVAGLYIAGELGGRGLIKLAINQGKAVIEHLAARRGKEHSLAGDTFDVVIVGAGPAGISATLSAKERGLRSLTLEQGDIASTIRHYPRKKFLLAEPVAVPIYGNLWVADSEKETLLEVWEKIIEKTGIEIRSHERVVALDKANDLFRVVSEKGEYRSRFVVLAIGKRGSPRKLGVPGEGLAKVMYQIADVEAYENLKILVVGGGDSAAEAAVALSRSGTNVVHLVHRGGELARVKSRIVEKLNEAIARQKLTLLLNSHVREIRGREVVLQAANGVLTLDNDYVFAMIGGETPFDFLKKCGIEVVKRREATKAMDWEKADQ